MMTTNARVAQVSALVVWAGAFLGSAAELTKVGETAGMAVPASLPISLDLVAVAAAAARAARPDDALAEWGLRVFTLVSLILQVATTPWPANDRPLTFACSCIARAAPVLGSWLAFELTLRAAAAPAEAAQGAQERPAELTGPILCPEPLGAVDELLPVARQAVAELRRRGWKISRRNLLNAMADLGQPVGSHQRADALLAAAAMEVAA